MRLLAVLLPIVAVLCGRALALEVPLIVRETENVSRVMNPVNAGVPLPVGLVKDVGRLRLLDAEGKPVLASIEARNRWLEDESLKWITVHFLTSIPAGGERAYVLTDRAAPAPASPLSVTKGSGSIEVVTGPARFVVPLNRLAPFDEVHVRDDPSKPFSASDALLERPAAVRLTGRNGLMRVVNGKAELVRLGDSFTHTGRVESAKIEEDGPGRAVVALKGTFSTPEVQSLDFTARLYFYAGSPLAQMTFSVRNRQMDTFAAFVGIEGLVVEVPLRRGASQPTFALSLDGATLNGTVRGDRPLTLFQSARNRAALTVPGGEPREGQQSPGWIRLTTGAATLTAGNRWFWQTYPKGVRATPAGVAALELAPAEGKRVDLFTGGAKTHFLFFHFAKDAPPAPESIAAGTTHPLTAQCRPAWYCEKTKVFGDLYSNTPNLFEPRYRDVIARFQANIDRCIRQIVKQRPQEDWPYDVDEYGWLDFGSGLHARRTTRKTSEESWWDSNYYGFPHAAIVNYLRTGDLINLTTAEEAGLHLADIDICHCYPGNPEWAGSPRSGPVLGHFRDYTRDQAFTGHNSFTFYKNEGLYELYYLTGERWYREVGLMSSDFALARWGQGALRNLAHGIWGVLSAYRDTHDPKYLARARFFVDKWAKPWQDQGGGSFKHPRFADSDWHYGLQMEAYHKYYMITKDVETARYAVRAMEALVARKKGSAGTPINLMAYGVAYEYSGDESYFNRGLKILEVATRSNGTRVKTFAQQFRSSPYFLKYLTIGYRASPVVGGSTE